MKIKTKLFFISGLIGTSLLLSTSVSAKNNISIKRLAGQDRYGTSNAIVSQGWTQSDYAVLVNSQNFPDAITSSPLAKKYNAPILLTDTSSLTDSTKQKLKDLGVKNVFIIGGAGVVSSNVENELKNMSINVNRLWGQNRYETSVSVAKELGTFKGVFVVNGEYYEDALSVAPIAAKLQYPVILVGQNNVPDTVKNYVNSQVKASNGEVNVIGGDDVLTNNVINTLNPTKTYNQSNKYDRNLALINNYKGQLDLDKVYVASDKGFADALSGSALAGKNENPIILIGDSNKNDVNDFINNNNVVNVNVLGGTGVLSDYVVNVITGNTTATDNTDKHVDTVNSIVTFKDSNLEKVIRDAINKPTGDIYKSDVENITSLDGSDKGIADISGIENLTNLKTLSLNNNKKWVQLRILNINNNEWPYIPKNNELISDISPLKELSNLEELYLDDNQIIDISPLKELSNLKKISLATNQIRDISALKELSNLQEIQLAWNKISDISVVKDLHNLQRLLLVDNEISDISVIKGLSNLKSFYLNYNQISDISALKELTNLQVVGVSHNKVSDISALKGLVNLKILSIYDNPLRDISALKGLSKLERIEISINSQISNSDIKELRKLFPKCEIRLL